MSCFFNFFSKRKLKPPETDPEVIKKSLEWLEQEHKKWLSQWGGASPEEINQALREESNLFRNKKTQ